MLVAHILAFENVALIMESERLIKHIGWALSDLKAAIRGEDSIGYCNQKRHREEGITALLAANISKCFTEYCLCKDLPATFSDQLSIMHQATAGKGCLDISLFYHRRIQSMVGTMRHLDTSLCPLLFIEFTKTSTDNVNSKLPQAALYSNLLFQLMKVTESGNWVPLLGIIMSEDEMLFRLYSPSLVGNKWKIAEVDIMRCSVSTGSIRRLLHVMVGWAVHCAEFLSTVPNNTLSASCLEEKLTLQKGRNVLIWGNKIFKCFDYREICDRNYDDARCDRRDPHMYARSDLSGLSFVVDWTNHKNSMDNLQIISYDMVQGSHCPCYIGHFTEVFKKLLQLHTDDIVHGDLRFSNIVFSAMPEHTSFASSGEDDTDQSIASQSAVSMASTIIDFDHTGIDGQKTYPSRFNLNIDDGRRHAEALPNSFLRKKHDIFAVQWMCLQYQPKKDRLKKKWIKYVAKLSSNIQCVIDKFAQYLHEDLEPVDEIAIYSDINDTGSPHIIRRHYHYNLSTL